MKENSEKMKIKTKSLIGKWKEDERPVLFIDNNIENPEPMIAVRLVEQDLKKLFDKEGKFLDTIEQTDETLVRKTELVYIRSKFFGLEKEVSAGVSDRENRVRQPLNNSIPYEKLKGEEK